MFVVISLIPQNPFTVTGWKSDKANAGEKNCKNENGKVFIQCIEDNSYLSMNISSRIAMSTKHFYMDNICVMAQSLQVKTGDITDDPRTTLQIPINGTLIYHIVMTDPKMLWTPSQSNNPQVYQIYYQINNFSVPASIGISMKV